MKLNRYLFAMALGLVLVASSAAICQQLFVYQTDYTWNISGNRKDNDIFWPKDDRKWADLGFTDPIVYFKLDVINRPTTDKLCLWLCLWNTDNPDQEVCAMERSHGCMEVTTNGTYYFDYGQLLKWPGSHGSSYHFDLNKPLVRVLPQFRIGGAKLHGDKYAKHLPFDIHFELVIVENGKKLAAPEGWTCPADWGCDGSAVSARSTQRSAAQPGFFAVAMNRCAVNADGPHMVKLMDTQGRILKQFSGSGKAEYDIAGESAARGMHLLSIESSKESAVVPLVIR